MRKEVKVIATILILFTSFFSLQLIQVTKANPYAAPIVRIESPQNNTVIYGTDSANISFTLETPWNNDYYYSVDKPIIPDQTDDKTIVNLPEKPIIINEHPKIESYHCNIQVTNLVNGQHSVTLYCAYDDFIITTWYHVIPITTINFSIEGSITQKQTPIPSSTVDSFPVPTQVPEFPAALCIVFLAIIAVGFVAVYRKNRKE